MAKFEKAIEAVLAHEGRWYADPRGGDTDYGISLSFLKILPDEDGDGFSDGDLNRDGIVCAEDVKHLTLTTAQNLYRRYFWDKYRYGQIVDQDLATKVMDFSVNMGPRQAHLVVQRALAYHVDIVVDGFLGPKSLSHLNAVAPLWTLGEIRHEAAKFYRSLNDPVHLKGWLNRAYA